MSQKHKPAVLNPLTLRNNVGSELALILEQFGITDYANQLHIKDLRKKEKLSASTIKKIRKLLGSEHAEIINFIINFQNDYIVEKLRCQKAFKVAKRDFCRLRKTLILLKDEFSDGYDLLDDILYFFGVENTAQIFRDAAVQEAIFREQNGIGIDPINLHAWLRKGEIDFHKMELGAYNKDLLLEWVDEKTWLQYISDVDYFKQLPEIFKTFGVALSFVPCLSKTVFGAVRWINSNPLIEISNKNRDLSVCWFTLFHELGHIILHHNINIYDGNIQCSPQAPIEKEANKFAKKYLFNGDEPSLPEGIGL